MSERSRTPKPELSRRQFVTLVAAGSAALLAQPLQGLAATTRRKGAAPKPGAKPAPAHAGSAATQKEFERQRASTLDTLKTIRGHAMGPGTELAFVFRPMRSPRKER